MDSSMITYLDEMNRKSVDKHRKSMQAVRKSSIETAEFMHNHEEMLSRRKHTQTIDVDLSHREHLE
jgi:hypothetical protein